MLPTRRCIDAARTLLGMGSRIGRISAGVLGVAAASIATASGSLATRAMTTPADLGGADRPPAFSGPYANSRAILDYTYHTRPSAERQELQDIIISKALGYVDDAGTPVVPFNAPRLPQPWLLFTCGAMGAGKGRVLRYLHSVGACPLESFVLVDPDKLKEQLPELQALLLESPQRAHTALHRESTLMAELIEREAMLQGRSVIVDGSLRNTKHYAQQIGKIRAEFPHYRIALLWVKASNETVYQRAEKRARITGRHVPKEVLDSALKQVPTSFAVLSGLCDYAGIVDNDTDDCDPVFASPFTLEEFAGLWKQEPKDGSLPAAMFKSTTTTTAAKEQQNGEV
jgi:predicted kinase